MDLIEERSPQEKLIIAKTLIEGALQELPCPKPETAQNVPNNDLVSRKMAIDAFYIQSDDDGWWTGTAEDMENLLKALPSVQPTLYGYDLELLSLIASVMAKKGISPEEAVEIFTDIRSVYQMVVEEQKEIVKGVFEQWTI